VSSFHSAMVTMAIVSLATVSAHRSFAQDEKIAAEAIFNEARSLMDQGRYAEACPKLAESQRLDPAVGTLLYLGECYEKEGKVASAWAAFKSAASAARNAGQTNREQTARQRATELEPRLPKLTLVVPPGSEVPGLVVQRDDIDVGSVAWGSAVPVDPGKHRVAAKAPGKKPWSKDVDVGTQPTVTTVTLPRLEDDNSANPAPAPPASATPSAPNPGGTSQSVVVWAPPAANAGAARGPLGSRPHDSATTTAMHVAGISLGTLGLAGLAVGTVYELKSQSKLQDAKSNCNNYPTDCSAQGVELNRESRDASSKATIGFVVGGGLLVTGIVVYVLAPSTVWDERGTAKNPAFLPTIGPHQLGWMAQSSF
jgi:hypothetical protein